MARKLKVFSTPVGFFTAVVAAPSQKAALEAWGVREDLFASGAARAVTDADWIEQALARPGEIVRIPISTDAAFAAAAKAPPKAAAKRAGPDPRVLDAAKAKLAEAEKAREALPSELAAERVAFDRRQAERLAQAAAAVEAAKARLARLSKP